MPFPAVSTIETERLRLVPVTSAHLGDLLAVNGDDEVTRFLPYASWPSLEAGHAWLSRMEALAAAGTGQQLVLVRRVDGKAVGTLLFFRHEEVSRRLELGYALARACWHQGLMREAVAAACEHAFTAMGVRRIEAEVNPANHASCTLLSKIGFVLEGRLRQRWAAKGIVYDTHLYGLLAAEHATRKAGGPAA